VLNERGRGGGRISAKRVPGKQHGARGANKDRIEENIKYDKKSSSGRDGKYAKEGNKQVEAKQEKDAKTRRTTCGRQRGAPVRIGCTCKKKNKVGDMVPSGTCRWGRNGRPI